MLADMAAVAREAGALTLRHFARFRELEIGIKGPADFVSDADREFGDSSSASGSLPAIPAGA